MLKIFKINKIKNFFCRHLKISDFIDQCTFWAHRSLTFGALLSLVTWSIAISLFYLLGKSKARAMATGTAMIIRMITAAIQMMIGQGVEEPAPPTPAPPYNGLLLATYACWGSRKFLYLHDKQSEHTASSQSHSCQHSKFQLVMKSTETNCPLVFEAILYDSTLNTRRMLKLFSLLIARLHSGGCHDETVGSSLVPVYYPLLQRTNWYPDKQGINTTLIDIHDTFREFRTYLLYTLHIQKYFLG